MVAAIEVLMRAHVIPADRGSGLMALAAIFLVLGALIVLRPLLERGSTARRAPAVGER